jgi:hypothetical protein
VVCTGGRVCGERGHEKNGVGVGVEDVMRESGGKRCDGKLTGSKWGVTPSFWGTVKFWSEWVAGFREGGQDCQVFGWVVNN